MPEHPAVSSPRGARQRLPAEVIARICSHVSVKTLHAVLVTGWVGYGAALPHLYADVTTDDIVRLAAGLTPSAAAHSEAATEPPPDWPNALSHERKRRALQHVRRIRVGSWLTRMQEDDPPEDGPPAEEVDLTPAPEVAALAALSALDGGAFPRLQSVIIHSAAAARKPCMWAKWHETDRIMVSALFLFLSTLKPAHVCYDVGNGMEERVTYARRLADAWANPSLSITLHSLSPDNIPFLVGPLQAAKVRWWTERLTGNNCLSPREPPGVYDFNHWDDMLFDITAQLDLEENAAQKWEIVGVRKMVPLTCSHVEEHAAASFHLRTLLHLQHEKLRDGATLRCAGASESCPACGRSPPAEAWYSAPLAQALGEEHAELVDQMRALDATLPALNGPCVRTRGGRR